MHKPARAARGHEAEADMFESFEDHARLARGAGFD